jgi:hypothetical protein
MRTFTVTVTGKNGKQLLNRTVTAANPARAARTAFNDHVNDKKISNASLTVRTKQHSNNVQRAYKVSRRRLSAPRIVNIGGKDVKFHFDSSIKSLKSGGSGTRKSRRGQGRKSTRRRQSRKGRKSRQSRQSKQSSSGKKVSSSGSDKKKKKKTTQRRRRTRRSRR